MIGGWHDAARQLRFERSHAPSAALALQRWLAATGQRLGASAELSTSERAALARAEHLCYDLGLGYGTEDPAQTAPWHLPQRFARIPAADLPAHPAIDPAFAAAELPGFATQPALQALAQLADPQAWPQRWAGLPLDHQPPAGPAAPVAVCLHLYYLELWPLLWQQLQHIPQPWDLLLSVPAFAAHPMLRQIAQDQPRSLLWPVPNRGRDVAPFLRWQQAGVLDRYNLVCKLHGKHSPHRADGAAWRDSLLDGLLGSAARVHATLARFEAEPRLGLLAPEGALVPLAQDPGRAVNQRWVSALAERLRLSEALPDARFAAGTMFWCRPAALQPLKPLADDPELFPPEMRQTDGTPAHALERLIGVAVQSAGYGLDQAAASRADAALLGTALPAVTAGNHPPHIPPMTAAPFFSIILPTYNCAELAAGALDSLLAQTERDFELVVSDGASTDGTLAEVAARQDRLPAATVLSRPDRGVYDAINRGIAAAKGRWVYVLGSDDRFHQPDTLARVRAAMGSLPAPLVYGDVRVLGKNAMVADGARYGGPFNLARMMGQNICQQACFYQRSLFDRLGLFNERYRLWADWDFAQRVFVAEAGQWIDVVVADYAATGMSSVQLDTVFQADERKRMRALWTLKPLGHQLVLARLRHWYWNRGR